MPNDTIRMTHHVGHCKTLICSGTQQTRDYSRYHLGRFDAEVKCLRLETVFPQDCQKAFELGVWPVKGN